MVVLYLGYQVIFNSKAWAVIATYCLVLLRTYPTGTVYTVSARLGSISGP